jgi:cytochrome b561
MTANVRWALSFQRPHRFMAIAGTMCRCRHCSRSGDPDGSAGTTMTKKVTGYSRTQIALHWMVVIAVAVQFVANGGMVSSWRAALEDRPPSSDDETLAWLHIATGSLVLVLAVARIFLRFTRGAPPPPADEPKLLQLSAEAVHYSIYALLLMLPLSGLTAWYLGVAFAATLHSWGTNILLGAIALHIGGALFQHLVRRSDVLMRMFRPQAR